MFGTQSANVAVGKVAGMMSKQVAKKLPQKALTKGVIYPLVKKSAAYLGVQMTKQSFAKGVSKAIPVVGAVVSGGLTLATYLPMAKRLKKHLAGLPLADPSYEASEGDVVDGEVVEEHETLAPADAEPHDADTTTPSWRNPGPDAASAHRWDGDLSPCARSSSRRADHRYLRKPRSSTGPETIGAAKAKAAEPTTRHRSQPPVTGQSIAAGSRYCRYISLVGLIHESPSWRAGRPAVPVVCLATVCLLSTCLSMVGRQGGGGVDPISVGLLLALSGGAGGEIGRQAWVALSALVRRPFRGGHGTEDVPDVSMADAELAELERSPADAARAHALSTALAVRAAVDAEFRNGLEEWREQARHVCSGDGEVKLDQWRHLPRTDTARQGLFEYLLRRRTCAPC